LVMWHVRVCRAACPTNKHPARFHSRLLLRAAASMPRGVVLGDYVTEDLHRHRSLRITGVYGEQAGKGLELLWRRAVVESPPSVGSEPRVDSALHRQGGKDDETAVTVRETVVGPGGTGCQYRLGRKPLAHPRAQVFVDLMLWDLELACVSRKTRLPPWVAVRHCAHGRSFRSQIRSRSRCPTLSTDFGSPVRADSSPHRGSFRSRTPRRPASGRIRGTPALLR